MSFVLVLAAAVTLVVGLLQSGLTLIYLSIACSVLAGVVLAVAVLRGRPEPRPAAAGRSFTPPARPAQEPASVGAYPSAAETSTTSWSAPTSSAPPAPTPPPPPPPPRPASGPSDDEATKAAGTALLGRLRGKRAQTEGAGAPAPEPEPVPVPAAAADTGPATANETMEIPVVRSGDESDDGFPIADYDRLRATELLGRLPALDRNQLEAVRQREASGKNRFTVMSRIDSLLAAQQDPAWQVEDEEWESGVGTDAESEAVVIEAQALQEEEDFGAALDAEEGFAAGEVEDDEVDQMGAPDAGFPIAGYESLTVGQILPRLSDLDADQLAQVRAREQEGRGRGTILDRIDRLAAKSGARAGAMAMPAAGARKSPARKAPARKAPARKASPAVEAAPAPPPAPAPAAKKTRAKKAPVAAPPVEAPVKKARARKAAAPVEAGAIPLPAPEPTPPPRKAPPRARKAAAPAPAPPVEAPAKKARAKKAAAPAKKSTKRP